MTIYTVIQWGEEWSKTRHYCNYNCQHHFGDPPCPEFDETYLGKTVKPIKSFVERDSAIAFIKGTKFQIIASDLIPAGAKIIP